MMMKWTIDGVNSDYDDVGNNEVDSFNGSDS